VAGVGLCRTEQLRAATAAVDDPLSYSHALWFDHDLLGVDPTPDAQEGLYSSPNTDPFAIAAPAYDHEMITIQVDAASGGHLLFEIEWGIRNGSTGNCSGVFPEKAEPQCSTDACNTNSIGNGRCNPTNNVCGCDWDGGDCCGDSGKSNQYSLCSPGDDGTCCEDPDYPSFGEIVVEYLVNGRNTVWSALDLKFLDTWLTLDSISQEFNTSNQALDPSILGPMQVAIEVPPHFGLPCTPEAGCFGELGCDSECPAGELTTFRIRQGDGHDSRIGWSVWDFSFEAYRDTFLTVIENQMVITEFNTTQDQVC